MTDLPEGTGDERVDAALGGLAVLGELPVAAHPGVFEEVFAGLERALAAADGTGPATADGTAGGTTPTAADGATDSTGATDGTADDTPDQPQ
ncbi:hypothetical protein [Planobispora rosea]|uniref:hypothetical protein n=1 Tax=Planobispora rosea TaxID=35762 RepID=UPI00083AA7C0|nr:hypothetical protein [Planobispora rosea]